VQLFLSNIIDNYLNDYYEITTYNYFNRLYSPHWQCTRLLLDRRHRCNWSDLTHWATTSGGGVAHTQLPTSTDNVFFDANSFDAASQVITLDVEANCKNMNWTGASNFPTISGNGNDANIFGSLTLSPDMAANFSNVEIESTDTGNTITTNGTSLGSSSNAYFLGVGGEWTFQDIFTTNGLFVTAGTLNTNNNTISRSAI